MPDTLIGMVFELVTHAGKHGIDLGARRANRAMGFEPPSSPALRSLPEVPPLPQIPPMPTAPALGGVAGGLAGLAAIAPIDHRGSAPETAPGAFGPPPTGDSSLAARKTHARPSVSEASEAYSYSDEVAAGVACANCLRKHLGTVVAEAEAAQAAVLAGDERGARAHMAKASAELAALDRYDLTDEKIRATPADRRGPITASLPYVAHLRSLTATPDEVALAWGAADESIRFARSTNQTDRDRQEIALRLRDVDSYAAYTERDLLGPSNVRRVLAALPASQQAEAAGARDSLRAAGHALDRGDPTSAQTLDAASAHLEAAAVALTPPPTPDEAAAFLAAAKEAQAQFYDSYLAMMQAGDPRAAEKDAQARDALLSALEADRAKVPDARAHGDELSTADQPDPAPQEAGRRIGLAGRSLSDTAMLSELQRGQVAMIPTPPFSEPPQAMRIIRATPNGDGTVTIVGRTGRSKRYTVQTLRDRQVEVEGHEDGD